MRRWRSVFQKRNGERKRPGTSIMTIVIEVENPWCVQKLVFWVKRGCFWGKIHFWGQKVVFGGKSLIFRQQLDEFWSKNLFFANHICVSPPSRTLVNFHTLYRIETATTTDATLAEQNSASEGGTATSASAKKASENLKIWPTLSRGSETTFPRHHLTTKIGCDRDWWTAS